VIEHTISRRRWPSHLLRRLIIANQSMMRFQLMCELTFEVCSCSIEGLIVGDSDVYMNVYQTCMIFFVWDDGMTHENRGHAALMKMPCWISIFKIVYTFKTSNLLFIRPPTLVSDIERFSYAMLPTLPRMPATNLEDIFQQTNSNASTSLTVEKPNFHQHCHIDTLGGMRSSVANSCITLCGGVQSSIRTLLKARGVR
jgi:hypothetical protein